MALIRAQVSLAHSSGLPEDRATNTFHFSTSDVLAATLDAIQTELVEFYTATPVGGTAPLSSFFSTEMAQNGHTITMYNLDEAEPRVPIREHTFNLAAAPNGDPLPGEVALCLSFEAAPISGGIQARRRGRIYLGRLDKDSSSAGRPSATLIDNLVAAGENLLAASTAAGAWSWIVLSVANPGTPTRPAYPQTFAAVDQGWVDNAFDTQRRRGLAPTTRELFT